MKDFLNDFETHNVAFGIFLIDNFVDNDLNHADGVLMDNGIGVSDYIIEFISKRRVQFLFVILKLNNPTHTVFFVLVTQKRLGVQTFSQRPLLHFVTVKFW